MTTIATILVNLAGLYLVIGLIFAIWFVIKGARTVDPAVEGTSIVFKLLIIPGSILLWPVLMRKWNKAKN